VAKNLPFVLEIRSDGNTIKFEENACIVKARLIYDYNDVSDPEILVPAVKIPPLEFNAHFNSSDSLTLECRLKVLTRYIHFSRIRFYHFLHRV
jgi:hypothetical protein